LALNSPFFEEMIVNFPHAAQAKKIKRPAIGDRSPAIVARKSRAAKIHRHPFRKYFKIFAFETKKTTFGKYEKRR
jgi:hypothetical protein